MRLPSVYAVLFPIAFGFHLPPNDFRPQLIQGTEFFFWFCDFCEHFAFCPFQIFKCFLLRRTKKAPTDWELTADRLEESTVSAPICLTVAHESFRRSPLLTRKFWSTAYLFKNGLLFEAVSQRGDRASLYSSLHFSWAIREIPTKLNKTIQNKSYHVIFGWYYSKACSMTTVKWFGKFVYTVKYIANHSQSHP